jgi:hypothetical protein
MFSFNTLIIATLLATSTAFFSSHTMKSAQSIVDIPRSTRTALSMMSDTKKKMGKSVVGTTLPEIPNEMEVASPFFQRTPPGTGMDERCPMIVPDELKALEAEKISKIYKSFRQNSLKMILESNTHGSVDKLNRISLASSVQSILPGSFISGSSKVSCISAGGLFDDWNSAIDM